MRIPVNSCPGCNGAYAVEKNGTHILEQEHADKLGLPGNIIRCAFVDAELKDLPDVEFVAVYHSKVAALHRATQVDGCLLWSGQGPWDLWLVLRDKSR
jgi:hypothetical protein